MIHPPRIPRPRVLKKSRERDVSVSSGEEMICHCRGRLVRESERRDLHSGFSASLEARLFNSRLLVFFKVKTLSEEGLLGERWAVGVETV